MGQDRPPKKAKVTAVPLKSALKKREPASVSDSVAAKVALTDSPTVVPPNRKSAVVEKKVQPFKKPLESKRASAARQHASPKPKPKVDKGKSKAAPKSPTYPSSFKVIAGSYEKLLYGLEGTFIDEDGAALERPRLKPIFIFPAHVSCVKAVAASPDGGKWLATGSTDEIIKIWDLRRRKEIGGLVQHEGSITGLGFPTRSHLMSSSEDGTICIFRARDWVLLRSMKGHKGRVNSVAVHPSGKVGLSVGKDRTLRMWDLMRGKGSASTKLGKEGELVRWSAKGDRFVVQSESTIDIYSTEMALLCTFTHPSRVQDVRFCSNLSGGSESEFLLVAAEDKKVTIYGTTSTDSTSLPVVAETIGHQNRVKAIDTLAVANHSLQSWTTILSTVSSDGWIRIFDLGTLTSLPGSGKIPTLESIAEYDTKGSRLTCCALADGEARTENTLGKRGLEDKDVESDDDGKSDAESDGNVEREVEEAEASGTSEHDEGDDS